jgi:putative methyltransferase (TIGR04325 family)
MKNNPLLIKIIKKIIPPIIFDLYRYIFNKPLQNYKYGYNNWEEVTKAADGYDGDDIIEKTYLSAKKVALGLAVYERDSVLFDKIEYSWELLSSLLFVAVNSTFLNIIDFGGGLGTTYMQNRKYLSLLNKKFNWKIVEQEKFVQLGKTEFETQNLLFFATLKEASISGVDVVLFGSSICYVSNPFHFIEEAIGIGANYIIFDRTPISKLGFDQFVLQKVSAPIYNATYPMRVFKKENLIKPLLNSSYVLVEEWTCIIQSDPNSISMGFLLMKK